MHTMTVDSFVPMLESLSEILDKAASHAGEKKRDLLNARLAPDMYTLTRQVQLACDHARNGTARLVGQEPKNVANDEKTIDELKARIEATVVWLNGISADAFEGAEARDCSVLLPDKLKIEMDGLRFLRAWALPHFYFHLVTAYDILRQSGVVLGKQDYLSEVGAFIRPVG